RVSVGAANPSIELVVDGSRARRDAFTTTGTLAIALGDDAGNRTSTPRKGRGALVGFDLGYLLTLASRSPVHIGHEPSLERCPAAEAELLVHHVDGGDEMSRGGLDLASLERVVRVEDRLRDGVKRSGTRIVSKRLDIHSTE